MATKAAMKATLLAEYEAALDTMLAKRKPDDEITLSEIETLVGEVQQAVGKQMLQQLTQIAESEQPLCPQCGGRMQYKGKRPKQVVTTRGEVTVQSAYHYCAACKRGFSPSARALGDHRAALQPGIDQDDGLVEWGDDL
jgi:tRNA(Ile2) C34 agmatinyltransferase TiaS